MKLVCVGKIKEKSLASLIQEYSKRISAYTKLEIIEVDDTWYEALPQEIINSVPIGSSEYPYLCDYYKLVDLTTNTINEISSNDENHQYVLYCLQIEKKRLIAIKFEV